MPGIHTVLAGYTYAPGSGWAVAGLGVFGSIATR